MYKEHSARSIVVKKAIVDRGIEPVVRWINSFESAITVYSCQGGNDYQEAYVLFLCSNPLDLTKIVSVANPMPPIQLTSSITVDYYNDTLRYRMGIPIENLARFIRIIKKPR